ncbi:sugar transporter [Pelistega ratti]|uniref:sugar transporter n=1 Tax=Pelistega ratti TaxID=2652177 RepID=UPI00135BF695|nr:sugar transporter [Pelistega ratti]
MSQHQSPTTTHENGSWFVIAIFAFAAFIFNTTEFVPIGLLPNIAQSLEIPESQTGLLMTIYAWSVTLLSIPLTLATARIERRKLLAILFAVFLLAHIVSAFAWDYYSLMASRLLIACTHAIFWAITIPLATRLAPQGNRIKALAFMVTGSSLATVLGVPLGTAIGQHIGWRTTFGLIAVIAGIIMILLIKELPQLPSKNAGSLKSLPSLMKRPTLVYAFLLTALTITGYFTVYTYITPYLREVGGFDETFVIWVLFTIGGAGIIGGYLFTRLNRLLPLNTYSISAIILIFCLIFLKFSYQHKVIVLALALFWGIAITLIAMSLQTKVLEAASDAADISVAIFSATFNIGIGSGALIGSMVLDHLGVKHITHIGSAFIWVALLIFLVLARRVWIVKEEPTSQPKR